MAELVRERHQRETAQAGLHIFLRGILGAVAKRRAHLGFENLEALRDRNFEAGHSEVLGELEGVFDAVARREGRGHGHASDLVGAKSLDGEAGDNGAVDPAAQAQHGGAEAALRGIVADSQNECLTKRFNVRDRRGGFEVVHHGD